MKRVFQERTELNHTGTPVDRRGWAELMFGAAMVAALVVATVVAAWAPAWLVRTDTRDVPPQPIWLQRIFYDPLAAASLYVREGADLIASKPPYTATVGEPYEYLIETSTDEGPVAVELLEAPATMKLEGAVNGHLLTWTPQVSDAGRENWVELVARSARGMEQVQAFDLRVARWPHPLGTDSAGLDMRAALLLGAQWTLLPGLIMVIVASVLGILGGGLAGFYGGWVDRGVTYVMHLVTSVPSLLFLFLVAALFHLNIYALMAAVGLVWFPRIADAVRSRVLTLKAQQFVEAARELGLRNRDILWREIVFYNTRGLLLSQISYAMAFAVLVEVTLSYLNLGIKPPDVSWGLLLARGRAGLTYTHGEFWLAIFPTFAVVLTIMGFYALGDGVHRLSRSRA